MSAIRSVFAKPTVMGTLALLVMVVASALAWTDRIDGPTYFGLAVVVAGFYFNKPQTPEK